MTQWKIVDANFLRSPFLEDYFRADAGNRVVFNDHGCMECYKGPGLENLARSLDIVSRYPSQVVVLKSTREIVALQSRSGYTLTRSFLVDKDQTREFGRFCEGVRHAVRGSAPELSEQLLAKSLVANSYFARARADAELASQGIRGIAVLYDPASLKQLRTRAPISADGGQVIIRGVLEVAAVLFRDHPDVDSVPTADELPGSLVFRHALAAYLLALRWISDGGVGSASPTTLANDLVDVTHVAYATYFDGVLSADGKLNDLCEDLDWFLRNIFTISLMERVSGETSSEA